MESKITNNARSKRYYYAHKEEMKARRRKWYADNRARALKRHREDQRKRQAYIDAYMKNHPCVDCGATEALVFHHLDPSTRTHKKSMVTLCLSRIVSEINLCVVLCKSCHAKRHNPKKIKMCPHCGHAL